MRNYLVSVSIVFLAIPLAAAAAAVTIEPGAQVTTTTGTYDIQSNINIDQVDAGSDSFTLSAPANANGSIDIVSPDRHTFTYSSVPGWNVTFTCDTNESKLRFSNFSTANNVTVTPSATTCTRSTSVSGAGGGGGGGGGGGVSITPTSSPTPRASIFPTPIALAPAPAPTSAPGFTFASDLSRGMTGDDVLELQNLLQRLGDFSGSGSDQLAGSIILLGLIVAFIIYAVKEPSKETHSSGAWRNSFA